MKERISLLIKYFLFFSFFFLLFSVMCSDLLLYDFVWNYGFSHAIRMGEIPYLDFNMISTPLYSFLMVPLLMLWDNYAMFLLGQAGLCTLFVGLLFKYVGKKAWLLLFVMSFPLFKAFIGTYNFLALVLIVGLFWAEDRKKNDLFLGILIGLLILTKQTIGGVVLLTNLLFLRDFKKILQRLAGVCLPCFIFFIYLIATKSLTRFIDLCFLGLFDFGLNNGNSLSILGVLSFLLVIFIVIRYVRLKDIKCSYALGAFFLAFPLFDYYHFSMFLTIFVLLFINEIKLADTYMRSISIGLLVVTIFFNILVRFDNYKQLEFLGFNRFEYYLVKDCEKQNFKKLLGEYQKYNNSIMVGDHAMLMDIAVGKKISYFDVTLKGNYGYNGTNKMINKVNNLKDTYFFIDVNKLEAVEDETQLDYKLLKAMLKKSKLVASFLDYNIYYKE